MKTHRLFRYLWRANAVLIFLSIAGACLLAGALVLGELGCNLRRQRAFEAAPPVVTDSTSFYLGSLKPVDGGNVLRGELMARGGLGLESDYGGRDPRNILYLDVGSTEARWLLPDSTRLISAEQAVWADESDANDRRHVANLALVKSVEADPELSDGSLLAFDPAGKSVRTVAEGVRALNHASLLDDGTILVIFERDRRYVRATLDAQTLEVLGSHEVSVPELR